MTSLKQATLVLLLGEDKILLAMKKRGFGAGHWNGVGGKPEPGESIKQTAIRECQEEIMVTPLQLQEVAKLDFYYSDEESWNQQVIVYVCRQWQGEPTETEEMAPKWFGQSDIPYDQMWTDDRYWLPLVLAGNYVKAEFHFDNQQKLVKHKIHPEPFVK